MGITAYFFAFDPRVYATPPTIDRWVERGELDRELEVVDEAKAWLKEIHLPLGDNKRWYDTERLHRPWIYDYDGFWARHY